MGTRAGRSQGWLLTLVALCVMLLVAGLTLRPRETPPGQPPPSGGGICLSFGQRAARELAELGAAWYMDWTFAAPDVPGHQRLYTVRPGANPETLAATVAAHRGAWWSLGNEPNDENQDNQTPAQHAAFFRDTAALIQRTDPTARIVSAGIANADWQWADSFREQHRRLTGEYPRLDAWNIHNYILDDDHDPYDVAEFKRRIAAFRVWLSQIGDGDKPLILSEFGVLYGAGCCERPLDPPEWGVAFMVETVTWLARGDLVQAWAWFMTNSGDSRFNGDLYDESGDLSPFGLAYRDLLRAEGRARQR